MAAVHTNRAIQMLRKLGVIDLRQRTLTVADRDALDDFAAFDPSYLQLGDSARRPRDDALPRSLLPAIARRDWM